MFVKKMWKSTASRAARGFLFLDMKFSGQYADDGKAKRLAVRAEAGHRCVRCGHPFESGKHGKGEWSPCDEQCTHKGERGYIVEKDEYEFVPVPMSFPSSGILVRGGYKVSARWRILTVHHLDGKKDNDAWWNTLALCQRCHLTIQSIVDPNIPWMLEHSDWFKPYVAGYYAKKYEGKDLSRDEVMARLDELLAYELRTA